jgi:uncharacterized protein YjiS (DUF1127 family)
MNTQVSTFTYTTTPQRMAQAIADRIGDLLQAMRRRRQRNRAQRELQSLSDQMLRDIGLHRAEIDSVVAESTGAAEATRRQVLASQQAGR